MATSRITNALASQQGQLRHLFLNANVPSSVDSRPFLSGVQVPTAISPAVRSIVQSASSSSDHLRVIEGHSELSIGASQLESKTLLQLVFDEEISFYTLIEDYMGAASNTLDDIAAEVSHMYYAAEEAEEKQLWAAVLVDIDNNNASSYYMDLLLMPSLTLGLPLGIREREREFAVLELNALSPRALYGVVNNLGLSNFDLTTERYIALVDSLMLLDSQRAVVDALLDYSLKALQERKPEGGKLVDEVVAAQAAAVSIVSCTMGTELGVSSQAVAALYRDSLSEAVSNSAFSTLRRSPVLAREDIAGILRGVVERDIEAFSVIDDESSSSESDCESEAIDELQESEMPVDSDVAFLADGETVDDSFSADLGLDEVDEAIEAANKAEENSDSSETDLRMEKFVDDAIVEIRQKRVLMAIDHYATLLGEEAVPFLETLLSVSTDSEVLMATCESLQLHCGRAGLDSLERTIASDIGVRGDSFLLIQLSLALQDSRIERGALSVLERLMKREYPVGQGVANSFCYVADVEGHRDLEAVLRVNPLDVFEIVGVETFLGWAAEDRNARENLRELFQAIFDSDRGDELSRRLVPYMQPDSQYRNLLEGIHVVNLSMTRGMRRVSLDERTRASEN